MAVARTATKRIVALIRSMKFLSPDVALYVYTAYGMRSIICLYNIYNRRPCREQCFHVWVGALSYYLNTLDKLQKQICRTVGPSLTASLQSYFGRATSELVELVPLPHSRWWPTHYSNRLHEFSVTTPKYYKDVYVNCSFPRTARLWNSFPKESFSLTYNLNGFFKSWGNRHLFFFGLFLCFSSFPSSFSCNSMPHSGYSALHRVKPFFISYDGAFCKDS